MEFKEMFLYGVVAAVGFVAGWAAKRYHHETESDVANAERKGREEGIEAGIEQGVNMLAENLDTICDENNVSHTGEDPKTGREMPYSLGELIGEASAMMQDE